MSRLKLKPLLPINHQYATAVPLEQDGGGRLTLPVPAAAPS